MKYGFTPFLKCQDLDLIFQNNLTAKCRAGISQLVNKKNKISYGPEHCQVA